ncbi:hypothetical protein [Actinokineospora iranica]|uniref:Uncharacterized protein n=1 Tax=Actinokineospora iranica TaxID=1271860 RepID=A0A1G6SU02_9PSEU|nr:hypothetical protein [Actinokineospora iranica]SDD20313.1 hypothetical protein SAMN05216174_108174 [Actinokineospora iranica]
MPGRRAPTAVVLTALLSALVAGAAMTGSALLRDRPSARTPATETPPNSAASIGVSGCHRAPCQVLATATVGGTVIDLVADAGAASGRLRIGGPSASLVIETTITELGATLTHDSLQCHPASISACLIRGDTDEGATGQVVVGRSGKWSPLARAFYSRAGHLALVDIVNDQAPEVLAVQPDCPADTDCAKRPVYAQVFELSGEEVGCSRTYSRIDQLPGYPEVDFTAAQLRPCS